MGQPQRTEVEVSFSRGQPYQQRVSWPVLQSTDKAWLIQTPVGEVWVPSYRWSHMPPGPGACANEQKLNEQRLSDAAPKPAKRPAADGVR